MGLEAREAWWPGIEWFLKLIFADESKNAGGGGGGGYVVVIGI